MLDLSRGGNDVLTGGIGEFVRNTLFGDARLMYGLARGGDDLLEGGGSQYSADALHGDAEEMLGFARGGDDRILGGYASSSVLIGDASLMSDFARGGDDTLTGPVARSSRGGITLLGDAGTMSGQARGGNDVFVHTVTGVADAVFIGDADTMSDEARGGDDIVVGYAFSPINTLAGDAWFLRDQARGGDDRLVSAEGSFDRMWGDALVVDPGASTGHDSFVFGPNNGWDQIYDFEQGKDIIDLTALASSGIHGIADLEIESGSTFAIGGDYTGSTIHFSDADLIFVADVSELRAEDFLFA
jgi:hypothetical protein